MTVGAPADVVTPGAHRGSQFWQEEMILVREWYLREHLELLLGTGKPGGGLIYSQCSLELACGDHQG